MSSADLHEIELLIERLTLPDQVRLLQFLAPRVAGGVLPHLKESEHAVDAWRRYRALGERLAATSTPNAPSMTDSVSQARR